MSTIQSGSDAKLAEGKLAHSEEDIILECQERFTFSQEGEGKNRSEFEFDKRFVEGDQWDPTIRDERFSDRRPCLTVNITDAITRRVINACRENRPRIVCHPVGNGADIDTAKVIDGLYRHIEYSSNAPYWYDTAITNSVQGGWGWLAVEGEYPSDTSFEQELKIAGYPNPLMCYGDPNSRTPDGSDMEWFIETQFMKRTEYRLRFGELDPTGWRWVGRGDDVPDWSNKEEIRVAKYWRVERKKDTLVQFSSGHTAFRSDMPKRRDLQSLSAAITKEREVLRRQVVCYLLTSTKILKTTEWPGKWIPRVPVYGRRTDLNGKMMLKGMVRDLRDPARIYNYAKTKETETYALQPQAQWVGPEGFMNGHEAAWRDTNRKPIVALEYKVQADETTGQPLAPPQRLDPPQVNQGFAEWSASSKTDFLAVAGMPHDPGQDEKGEVVSGIAIKRREGLADISNFDFYDNFCYSLRQLGRIVIDLIPFYYDTERLVRIIREDGTPSQVRINQAIEPGQGQPVELPQAPMMQGNPMQEAAKRVKNDLTVGDYEVTVDTGPSYQTRREQSAEAMLELLGTPLGEMVANAAGDQVVRAMDFPNADMVADRLAAMIPAAQLDAQLQDIPERARGIVAGLQQKVMDLMKQNMALSLEVETKSKIEGMKQQGETQRVVLKERGANERERMKTGAAMHDTHVKATTAHNVAEIGAAAQLLNTHTEQAHERQMAKEMVKEGVSAEKPR